MGKYSDYARKPRDFENTIEHYDKFIQNKYFYWYINIIKRARKRINTTYVEKHHITPKALDGSNESANLIQLTPKEHFVVHHLLTKCVKDEYKSKMWSAYFMMHIGRETLKTTARTYNLARKEMARNKSIQMRGVNNHFYGKKHSEETKKKMSASWNRQAIRNQDSTEYTFYHPDYGAETCTRVAFCAKYGIHQKRVWALVHKKQKTCFGWRIMWENTATL